MIPSKVKFDATTYDVEITERILIVNGRECKGMIDYDAGMISLSSQASESVSRVTLMHEITHGIMHERGLDFKEDNDECLVDEIARGFMEVMRANPELVQCICEDSMIVGKQKGA
jgi:Zn-dependent peptidase ImmA (M78 family)